jgi:GT2 family glycosyltransferase
MSWAHIDAGVDNRSGIPGLVSVVIPTFNRAPDIRHAIDSVLHQCYEHIEVLVADDGSADDTAQIVGEYGAPVRYFFQPNSGVAAARNLALREAAGEFIAFLDSDDAWYPWKLSAQVSVLRALPEVGMVWTDMTAVDERDIVIAPRHIREFYSAYTHTSPETLCIQSATLAQLCPSLPAAVASAQVYVLDLFSAMLWGNLVHTSTVLLRRSRLAAVGGFDESLLVSGEDYDFHLRTTFAGIVAFLDTPSIRYRVGAADQLTRPDRIVHVARNDLITIRRALASTGGTGAMSAPEARRRLASSYAWVGVEELHHGNARAARRALVASVRTGSFRPRVVAMLFYSLLPRSLRYTTRAVVRYLRRLLRRVS